MDKKKRNLKTGRLICLLLSTVLLVSGCKGEGRQGNSQPAQDTKEYGRYMETVYDLPEETGRSGGFTRLEDGRYRLLGYDTGIWTSADQGKTWTVEDAPWLRLLQNTYCSSAVYAPDGTMAAACNGSLSDSEVEAVLEEGTLIDGEMAVSREEAVRQEEDFPYVWNQDFFGLLVTPEGGLRFLKFEPDNAPGEARSLSKLWFSPDNRLFGTEDNGAVYEIDRETGSLTRLFRADAKVGSFAFTKDCLLAVGQSQLYCFDLKQRQLLEVNPAVNAFVNEKILDVAAGFFSDGFPVAVAAGREEKEIYLTCADGLFRSALESGEVEQIVDGALSTFGDEEVVRLLTLEDEKFLAQFADNSLILYTYDSTVPKVPDRELNVYSLTEQPMIRQAVTNFKKEHTDVYVRYEIGYTEEEGVSREEAVKNLNVRLAAGKGPDVLILEEYGKEADAYISKGMLADLSGLFTGMQGEDEVLPNIIEGMKTDGKLCLMPMYIEIPVIVGEREAIRQAQTLTGLADYAEACAGKDAGGIVGIHDSEVLSHVLTIAAAQSWMQDADTLREEGLREFLTQAKRIYEAEDLSVTQEQREVIDEIEVNAEAYQRGEVIREKRQVGVNVSYLAGGFQRVAFGELQKVWSDVLWITTLQRLRDGMDFALYQGQGKEVFLPHLLTGINAVSPNRDAAEAFLKVMFGRRTQAETDGFPVNLAALQDRFSDTQIELSEDYNTGISRVYPVAGREDRTVEEIKFYWPDPEQTKHFMALFTSVKTPAGCPRELLDTVCEITPLVMEGSLSVEEGLEQIQQNMALSLAE